MSNVISFQTARERKAQLEARELYSASPFHSPVPQLIELLEPILNNIREATGENVAPDLEEYLEVLELSRKEIDQLEDMAHFLLEVNQCNNP